MHWESSAFLCVDLAWRFKMRGHDITGETWKPYEAPAAPAASIARKSAAVEMAALELAA